MLQSGRYSTAICYCDHYKSDDCTIYKKPELKNLLLKEGADPKHLTDTDGKPIKLG